jgi:hypothetical protein
MPKTLLDFTTPRVTNARGPIRLSRLTDVPPSYGTSAINILQNNCYHGLEHEDPYDHIQTFLQYLGVVRPNRASDDYIKLVFFSFTL